jgi:hypothetical protein
MSYAGIMEEVIQIFRGCLTGSPPTWNTLMSSAHHTSAVRYISTQKFLFNIYSEILTLNTGMMSFMVEEPLEVIYFDGSSAAKVNLGHLDSQDLVIWGKIRPDKVFAEPERINKLCNWGGTVRVRRLDSVRGIGMTL